MSAVVRTPIATTITTNVPIDPCMLEPAFSTKANISINILIANTGPTSFSGLINDNMTMEAANIPIATAITVNVLAISLEPLVAFIRPVSMILNKPTITIPCFKTSTLTFPNNIHTPARIPMDMAMDNIVAPTLAISFSPPTLSILNNSPRNTKKPAANLTPFSISAYDRNPINFTTPTMMAIDMDIDSNVLPSLSTICFGAKCNTNINRARNAKNPPANKTPFPISSTDSNDANLTTPTINIMAMDSLIIIPPNWSIFLPPIIDILINANTNNENATVKPIAGNISSLSISDISLTAIIISNMLTASFFIITPNLSIF